MEVRVKEQLLSLFPVLRDTPTLLWDRIEQNAAHISVPAGTLLYEPASLCQVFPMLLSGSVRVSKISANGRELQLYRVNPGESCIITSSCLLGNAAYPAQGVTEGDMTAVTLSKILFEQLTAQHPPFRAYIFSLLGERLADLMQLVEEVAFHKLDQRLAALLLSKGSAIETTHQCLADELGSVREMISRLLKNFQDRGLVVLQRERIQITDTETLRNVARGSA